MTLGPPGARKKSNRAVQRIKHLTVDRFCGVPPFEDATSELVSDLSTDLRRTDLKVMLAAGKPRHCVSNSVAVGKQGIL